MNAQENRRRINALRAEEASSGKRPSDRNYGPERRRQAKANQRQMRAQR